MLATDRQVSLSGFLNKDGRDDLEVLDNVYLQARGVFLEYLQFIDAPVQVVELYTDLIALGIDMMARGQVEGDTISIFDWDIQMIVPAVVSNTLEVRELIK